MSEDTRNVILLPYDFTEVSKYAVKHAVGLAQTFGFTITVLNIMDTGTKMYMRLSNMPKNDIEHKLNETCSFIMQNTDVKVDYLFRKGKISIIHDLIRELKANFVVLGIDEPRGNNSPIMKMVGKSPRPILVVQQKAEYNGYKNILFPLDDHPTSRQKVLYAARIAKAAGAKMHILSALISDHTERVKHSKIVEQVELYFHKNEIPFMTIYAKGNQKQYAEELIEYSVANKIDLITIMHKPPTITAAVDKTDKRLIFNDAKIPVLCVNPRDLGVGGGLT